MPHVAIDPAIRDYLMGEEAIDDFTLKGKRYTAVKPVGHGFLGVVWEVLDGLGRRRAAKFTTHDDFQDKSYIAELSLSAKLEDYHVFARSLDAGRVDLNVPTPTSFICFIEDWIEGTTLRKELDRQQQTNTLRPSFLLAYVKQMCNALSALYATGLRHDDLHAGNVMLSPPPPGDLAGELRIKIVDMGSLKESSKPLLKEFDDHEQFIRQLVEIRNAIARSRELDLPERKFLPEVDRLLLLMADGDSGIALRDPKQIIREFEAAWTRAETIRSEFPMSLSSPFDFISAEHIADDKLLESIFADSCPWLPLIEGADPCLVTGPRGCGKSTIFRWLSLKTHLHRSQEQVDKLKISGFYISCSMDLQNRLGWIATDSMADRLKSGIVHYFNLIACREVISTLLEISSLPNRLSYWSLGPSQEEEIHRFIVRSITSSEKRLQGVPKLRQALELIETDMFRVHSEMLRDQLAPEHCTPETFLGDLTTLLVRVLPVFSVRKIAFLVDDFSVHRIPEAVQKILNRIIWERRSTHIFKLSSEKLGAVLVDVRNASADLTREMTEIDCGKEYLLLEGTKGGRKKATRFALDLLRNRMKAANYDGDPKTLLGDSHWPEKSLGKALISSRRGRREDQYHGIHVISLLCSGDVSSLLYVYRKIFEQAGITKQSNAPIASKIQHQAIRDISRRMTFSIQLTHPRGTDCYSVLIAFGQLVKLILRHGRPQKDAQGHPVPTQAPRIELDYGTMNDELTSVTLELKNELLRRAIFIDIDVGSSRHQSRVAMRWHLRRIYLPAFGAALSKNDAIKHEYDWLKYFLTNPEKCCKDEWEMWPRTKSRQSQRRGPESDQPRLPLGEL